MENRDKENEYKKEEEKKKKKEGGRKQWSSYLLGDKLLSSQT